MSIPKFQELMLPLLKLLEEGKERSTREAIETLAAQFKLTPEERQTLLPSGQQPVFDNRVGWARTYLKKAGLLESPRRGWLRITELGRTALQQHPDRIDVAFLMRFSTFRDWARQTAKPSEGRPEGEETATPEEQLAEIYKLLKQNLAAELLEQVRSCSPSFFERLVVRLLVAMGYGGSFEDAARAIGGSGDEGIDGIIKEDPLGLDVVYIQAKRWEQPVSRPEVQKFVGALQGHHARKGVFITTSTFTKEAKDYVARVDNKIVLIDGPQLADLMIENDVGVTTNTIYKLKRVDQAFFTEE